MLVTSKNVLFPGHNHLLATSTDDPSLWWLAGGYDLEIGHFYLVDSGFFLRSASRQIIQEIRPND